MKYDLMKCVPILSCLFVSTVASAALPPAEAVLRDGFTVTLKVDLDRVTDAEPLYEVGPVRLALRMAGADPSLKAYDESGGNYLNFSLPDGSCPVLEATIAAKAGRVGIPLGALARPGGVHDVTLDLSPVRWTMAVDGRHVDDDIPIPGCPVAWPQGAEERTLSSRVRSAAFASPSRRGAIPEVTALRPVTRSIQYWTPDDHNRWVGDVAPAFLDGKLHVFYLVDRRHHGSGAGTGRHQFAHLVTEDLVRWQECPMAAPIREPWQTVGTGTPFLKDGRLAIAFGWHTSRFPECKGRPIGGTYAVSEDGLNFRNSGEIISEAQNPSVYNLPDGRYELVTSFGGPIGIFRSADLRAWELFDAKLPFRGDCPSLFGWHGHRYLLQGFFNMAYSPDGTPGSFENWTGLPDKLYEGLSVPMVTSWKGDRRLYIGWLNHLHGWGGWLVFREVVYYPDGHLGLKWVPEIVPPVPPRTFAVRKGEPFRKLFRPEGRGPALVLSVDPATREASFADEAANVAFKDAHHAGNVRIGGVRGLDADYAVKVIVFYDAKSNATIFDAEIAGQRTLICRRPGRYAWATVEPSALFTDHAVLRRAQDTPVFGFAEPGTKVTVTLGAATAAATADEKGAWLARLDLRQAPQTPQTLTMNDVRAEDVLVGEVWLCSGQSNMTSALKDADDAEVEKAISNPLIRCFNVDVRFELAPNPRISGRWLRDVPQEKPAFTAVGYHFAKRLQAGLKAPVGIVHSSIGASTLEAWCDPVALAAYPEGKRVLDGQIAFFDNYRDYENRCLSALRAWETKWNRADRPHGAAPSAGWRTLTKAEQDAYGHGPGAVWFRRTVEPAPKGLVVSRARFLDSQWRFDTSSAEFFFNGRRLALSYPASPIEKNTELYVVPSAEAAKGGTLEVRIFNAQAVFDTIRFLSGNGCAFATAGWQLAEEFALPPLSAEAAKDLPPLQRFCLPQHYPCALHNGMIAGLVPMGLSGVVWYQGESNATLVEAGSGPETYAPLFEGFIQSWRAIFGKPELPFAWCQLASWLGKAGDANEGTTDSWVALRAAQQRALALPKTGQAILIDAGEPGNIHPGDKRTPGYRLADWALNRVYGRGDSPCRGPNVKDVAFANGKARVVFADCGRGLVARDLGETYLISSSAKTRGRVSRNSPAAEVEGFALAGADGVWHWADEATIRGTTVEVSAKAVSQPVAVRYGWSRNPWVNLYNAESLPAEPFECRQ